MSLKTPFVRHTTNRANHTHRHTRSGQREMVEKQSPTFSEMEVWGGAVLLKGSLNAASKQHWKELLLSQRVAFFKKIDILATGWLKQWPLVSIPPTGELLLPPKEISNTLSCLFILIFNVQAQHNQTHKIIKANSWLTCPICTVRLKACNIQTDPIFVSRSFVSIGTVHRLTQVVLEAVAGLVGVGEAGVEGRSPVVLDLLLNCVTHVCRLRIGGSPVSSIRHRMHFEIGATKSASTWPPRKTLR